MLIFMMLAMGLTSSTLMSIRIAEGNVLRNTAYTVTHGFIEQVQSQSYNDLKTAVYNTGTAEGVITVETMEVVSGVPTMVERELKLSVKNTFDVVIDIDVETGQERRMEYWVLPMLNMCTNTDWSLVEVTFDFGWEDNHTGGGAHTGTLRTVRTKVAE